MRMTGGQVAMDLPNTRLWRDDPRPMASPPLIVVPTASSVPSCSKLSRCGLVRIWRKLTTSRPGGCDVNHAPNWRHRGPVGSWAAAPSLLPARRVHLDQPTPRATAGVSASGPNLPAPASRLLSGFEVQLTHWGCS
jgi:hypothetical protein